MTDKCTFSEMKMERNRNMPETNDKNEIYDAGYDEGIQNVCEDSYRRGWRDGYDEGRKIGHSECAACPWQPMETAPKLEFILILDNVGYVRCLSRCKSGELNIWLDADDEITELAERDMAAWARINTPVEEMRRDDTR